MKYFKPELLARYRSTDGEVADAAAQEWDEASAAYRARFRSIRNQLPMGARRLHARFSLHDARLLGVAYHERKPLFGILIQLETSSGQVGEVLELNYHLVAGPLGGIRIGAQVASGSTGRRAGHILYDEFDLDAEHGFFTHTLLLADGREIAICLHNLTIRRLGHLLTPTELTERQVTWPVAEPIG